MNRADDIFLVLTLLKQKNVSEASTSAAILAGLVKDIAGASSQPPEISVSYQSTTILINGHSITDTALHEEILASVRLSLLTLLNQTEVVAVSTPARQQKKRLTAGVASAHFIFWLLNSIVLIWMGWALSFDSSVIEYFLNYFSHFFSEFGLKMLVAFISSSLLLLNPLLAIVAYFKVIKNDLASAAKINNIVFNFQVLQVLLSSISLGVATSPANAGIVILIGVIQTLPLITLLKILLPSTIKVKRITSLLALAWVSAVLSIAIYFAVLSIFILPLPLAAFFRMLGSPYLSFSSGFYMIIELVIFFVASAAYLFPFFVFWRIYKECAKLWSRSVTQFGRVIGWAVVGTALSVLFLSVWLGSRAPSEKYFDQLKAYNAAESFEQKAEVAKQLLPYEKQIEANYLAVRDSRQAFPISRSEGSLARSYEEDLAMSRELSVAVDQVFLTLAFPFVYPDEVYYVTERDIQDVYKVAEYYTALFGYYPGARKQELGLAFTDRPKVNLKNRKITAKNVANQQLIQVTIEEEYSNASPTDEEIIYEFSLPSSAVITDLKLGPQLEYQGQVAPRGAAEQVYEEQIRRNFDPALLEQIGPSQYRLRVFPIPGTQNEEARKAGNQKISFTYLALITPEGVPLPWYSREENISTALASIEQPKLDEKTVEYSDDKRYLQPEAGYCTRFTGISTGSGDFLRPSSVAAAGLGQCAGGKWQSNWNFTGKRIAVMVNVSARKDTTAVKNNLQQFFEKNESILTSNQITLLPFNTQVGQAVALTPQNWKQTIDNLLFFGTENFSSMTQLIPSGYDQVIIIANGQPRVNATNNQDESKLAVIKQPISLVYLDGPPPAMTLRFSQYLLNNGAVVTSSLEEALLFKAIADSKAGSVIQVGAYWLYDRPSWNLTMPKATVQELTQETSELQKIIISRLITEWLSGVSIQAPAFEDDPFIFRRNQAELSQIELLDYLHGIAKEQGIVTPYSSYIALVNSQQQQRLDQLSKSLDRYNEGSNWSSGIVNPTGWLTSPRGFSSSGASMLNSGNSTSRITPAIDTVALTAAEPAKQTNAVGMTIAGIVILSASAVIGYFLVKRKKTPKLEE